MKGSLEIICGSMFSGKTEELLRRLRRAEFAKQNVITLKPHIDTRKKVDFLVSHAGNSRKAEIINIDNISLTFLEQVIDNSIHVIGIDEVQFFPLEIVDIVMHFVRNKKRVVAAGLDLDFRGVPFSCMPTLLALADKVTKLNAICVKCGDDAFHTQRLINGKPARYDDPIILVGAEECYEARCRSCFEIEKQVHKNFTATFKGHLEK